MKQFITALIVAIAALTVGAQQTERRMATLIHGDQTSVFYDANALNEAYAAAADEGDIIILSEGEFNPITISKKSISIYGAGMEGNAETGTQRTCIRQSNSGNYSSITIKPYTYEYYDEMGSKASSTSYPTVYIEGIAADRIASYGCNELTLKKVKSQKLYFNNSTNDNVLISQCVLTASDGAIDISSGEINNLVVCNSHLGQLYQNSSYYNSTQNFVIDHCIIVGSGYNPSSTSFPAHYSNCIVNTTINNTNSSVFNCIFTPNGSKASGVLTGDINWYDIATNGIFADEGDCSYDATRDYALKYPQTYIGTDGTEVGINGGIAPFNRIPALPRIVASEIDTRTAEDGTLKVSITVEAQTKE